MSKGMNIFNHFNPPKSDGHKITSGFPDSQSSAESMSSPMVYCPKIKDTTWGNYTSAGMQCTHCKKIF